jgi:hypothetical protein
LLRCKHTGNTHGNAIWWLPAYVPEGKDVVAHDGIQADEDFMDGKVGWKVSGMNVQPSPNGFDTDVGVH